tara:strand:- start:575 stop:805 length:231 start_codon:yes stop_codon:yes gene_type:complete
MSKITTMGSKTDFVEQNPIPKGNSHTACLKIRDFRHPSIGYGNSLSSQFSPLLFFNLLFNVMQFQDSTVYNKKIYF